jgi:hypothetical protein
LPTNEVKPTIALLRLVLLLLWLLALLRHPSKMMIRG